MINKRGGIVASLKLGNLALVTAPSYDPSILLEDRNLKLYLLLYDSIAKPLYDRGLLASPLLHLIISNRTNRTARRSVVDGNNIYVSSWF
jgi:hypothetical protein